MSENIAKTIGLEEKQKLHKLQQTLYHTDEVLEIMSDISKDYMEQVALMKDDELGYDRSQWMLKYGNEPDEHDIEADIHTIAILIEQVRRFGRIFYDTKQKSVRLD